MSKLRRLITIAAVVAVAGLGAAAASAATVGTTFPAGFPTIVDASLGVPVIGFGGAGPVGRTPVIFLHGNNDTPFPTACNPYGNVHDIAQYLADHGYALGELWGLGYQGDQCDTILSPTNKSSYAHSTVANIPDLDRFVDAVLAYTGAKRVDIVGHSLGVTLARAWMKGEHKGHLGQGVAGRRRRDRPHGAGRLRPVPGYGPPRHRQLASDVGRGVGVPNRLGVAGPAGVVRVQHVQRVGQVGRRERTLVQVADGA